jgi:hypothetical protein
MEIENDNGIDEFLYLESARNPLEKRFSREVLLPYLKDIFNDLAHRCEESKLT